VGALSDESFINESMQAAVSAIVTASQDEVLRASIMSVVTEAVSDALKDEEFIGEFRGVIKGCLTDGEIYRSGAKGVISAPNPFSGRRKHDDSDKSM